MQGDNESDPKKAKEELKLSDYAGVGLQFALSIIIFLFIGQWADRNLGTSPVFLLAGVFLGGGAAFYSMYRRLSSAQKADDERRKRERERRR